ncbi:MAG: MarR family winged helix-turn-helix transcriptional regulator [Proteocatella sp.]
MEKSIGRLVSILYRKNQVYLNMVLKPLNLTASEIPILMCLFKHDGASQEALSSFISIDKASTARAVQALLEKGYIKKEKDSVDKRANKIFLTKYALDNEKKIEILLNDWTEFLTEGLDEQSVNIMFDILESMVRKIDESDFKEKWREK